MTIIHTVKTNTYNVLVIEENNEYCIVFNDAVTGRKELLERSEDEDYSTSSAKNFPKLYEIAQNEGYTLSGDEFVNKAKRSVTVSKAFKTYLEL
ncbi:hypothetical protein [Paenibacillus silvae]|uniref:Uncharacterized protein n=1 Tax=Paenibacillus silvae TaxID=1325358 RepID=A0A2W6NDU1_9BACL|nr:hypothetical protein [Paenibacillus silvae]PZT54147.1 hypothetical protein DN757_19140 [Paenibacillus silvae]